MQLNDTADQDPKVRGERRVVRKRRSFWKRRQFWIAILAIFAAIVVALWLISGLNVKQGETN